MMTALDHYTRTSAFFDARIGGVGQEQWDAPCPTCPKWTVTDLVSHVVGNHHHMLAAVGQQHTDPAPGDDLAAAWAAAHEAMLATLADPQAAGNEVGSPFGRVPFQELIGRLLSSDTLFHAWDLARATGQDDVLDPDACEQVLVSMAPISDFVRAPGRFADPITPPAGADAQTRLLCFGGRRA